MGVLSLPVMNIHKKYVSNLGYCVLRNYFFSCILTNSHQFGNWVSEYIGYFTAETFNFVPLYTLKWDIGFKELFEILILNLSSLIRQIYLMRVHLNMTGNRSFKMVIITYCKSQKRILVAPKTSRLKRKY